jgi:hypothetical protein
MDPNSDSYSVIDTLSTMNCPCEKYLAVLMAPLAPGKMQVSSSM